MNTEKDKADKERHDKETADERERERERDHNQRERDRQHDSRIENRDHDPKHPANTTLSPAPARSGLGPDPMLTTGLAPEDYMTEQEKDALATGAPGSKLPYPDGDPPPVHETTTRSQGIKGATDPKETPQSSSGPAGTTRLADKKETR
jgi:hypothetical protein